MEYKKLGQILTLAVAAVWVFCISFVVSLHIARSDDPSPTVPVGTQPPVVSTTEPTGTTAQRNDGIGNNASSPVSVGDPDWLIAQKESESIEASKKAEAAKTTTAKPNGNKDITPKTKSEIVKAYVDGVNTIKQLKQFTLYKNDTLNMTIDSISGGSLVQAFAKSLMEQNQKVPITYNFVNGYDAPTGQTPASAIAPLGKLVSLNESFVTAASATPNQDGGYTINMTLAEEAQIYPGEAQNLANIVEVVDVTPLLPSGAQIEYFELYYSNTTIEAVFNKDNQITYMKHYLNVNHCEGAGGLAMITMRAQLHGDFTSQYTFTY